MTYVGETKDWLRDGQGTCTFPGGLFRYEGAWVKGKMHGAGVFALPDGTAYEGEFEDGEINGVGLKRWPDGSTYSGSFREGEMHGDGVFLSAAGERYDGQWRNNKRQGSGELEFATKDVYRGEFRANKPDGVGKIVYALSGRSYDGEWRAGVRSGKGTLCDRSGALLYEGTWSNDKRHGQGVGVIDIFVEAGSETALPTALSYDGVWENDRPEDQTARIGVALLSQDGSEFAALSPVLTVENKQLPPLAVVCYSRRETGSGQSVKVIGESGRRVVLKIFEGHTLSQPPAAVEPVPGSAPASARDVESSPLSSQWQFVLDDPEVKLGAPTESSDAADDSDIIENGQTEDEDGSAQTPEEHRVDEVQGECKAGMVVFRGLRLPAATLAGSYYLSCESRTSDSLEIVHVVLSVVDQGAASGGGNQAKK